jgi:hypothetical protein
MMTDTLKVSVIILRRCCPIFKYSPYLKRPKYTPKWKPNMQAKTIDEVIEALDAIIETAKKDNSVIGYFLALYRKVRFVECLYLTGLV